MILQNTLFFDISVIAAVVIDLCKYVIRIAIHTSRSVTEEIIIVYAI